MLKSVRMTGREGFAVDGLGLKVAENSLWGVAYGRHSRALPQAKGLLRCSKARDPHDGMVD